VDGIGIVGGITKKRKLLALPFLLSLLVQERKKAFGIGIGVFVGITGNEGF